MTLKNRIFNFALIALTAATFAACGSGNGTTNTNTSTTPSSSASDAQEQQMTLMLQTISSMMSGIDTSSSSSLSVSSLSTLQAQTVIDCSGGGTLEVSETAVSYNNCDFGGVVMNGELTISTSGNEFTVTWSSFTVNSTGQTMTFDGFLSFNESTNHIDIDLDMGFGGDTYGLVASLDENSDETVSGTMEFSVNGSVLANCVFDGFDFDTASDATVGNACGF